MANPELQKLQHQLRKEIQAHQILVVKVKANPDDPELKKSIAVQQAKIATLSEKQKRVVEQLRSQLGVRNNGAQNEKKTTPPTPLGASQHLNIPSRPSTKSSPGRTHQSSGTAPGPLTPPRMSILTNKPSMFPIKVPQITCRLTVGNTEKKITLTKLDMSDKKIVKFREQKSSNPTKLKRALTPEEMKLEFMAALGLITQRSLEHLQNKRQERKRRSTANPQFSSYNRKELESRQSASSYLAATAGSKHWLHDTQKRSRFSPPEPIKERTLQAKTPLAVTRNGRPEIGFPILSPAEIVQPKPDVHQGICIVCHRSGELICCSTCRLAYHTHCLDPPVTSKPVSPWSCPKCKIRSSKANDWKGTLCVVQSYLAYKKRKEEEQRRLVQKTSDLRNERLALDERVKQLNEAITKKKYDSEELMKSYQRSENAVLQIKEIMSAIDT